MLRWLFLDMNSYFASVEQQARPELRGRPVAVAAVETDHTSCIAASVEAKRFGVKTGTPVGMARHMCPGLRVVTARPPLYVEVHHKIIASVEKHLHVDKVLSIDEMACRVPSNVCAEGTILGIAGAIKEALREEVGAYVRCSIGIAPNRFLAKVASDMRKPDGLVVLRAEELPENILGLGIRDLPGVGKNMELRLSWHGASTMPALWGMPEEAMVRAWGGVVGRQFWRNLHGENDAERETVRRSIGHSNVLSPERRTDAGAHGMLVRLVHKAGARLRDMKYAAGQMSMHVQYVDRTSWGTHVGLEDAQDTQTLLEAMDFLWSRQNAGHSAPKKVGIVLFDLEFAKNVTLPLFPRDEKRLELARAMDDVNGRFGRQTIYFGDMHDTRKSAPMRIAFNSVPDGDW